MGIGSGLIWMVEMGLYKGIVTLPWVLMIGVWMGFVRLLAARALSTCQCSSWPRGGSEDGPREWTIDMSFSLLLDLLTTTLLGIPMVRMRLKSGTFLNTVLEMFEHMFCENVPVRMCFSLLLRFARTD